MAEANKTHIFITVGRKWHNPLIYSYVDYEEIALSMTLYDFMEAVKQEMGSVATIFKRETFSRKVDEAVNKVLQGLKNESVKIAR